MGRIIVIEDNPVFAGYVCGLLEREALELILSQNIIKPQTTDNQV